MALHRGATVAASVLTLVAAWSLSHRFRGFSGDAKLYAFQALARIHPALYHDIFLENASQDRFTIFPTLYAWCIGLLGMNHAEMILTLLCKAGFLSAAWWLASAVCTRRVAFLIVLSLDVVNGGYGGGSVFQYSEDWLTARTVAEPMVLAATAMYLRDLKISAWLAMAAALLVHPLVALPGLLLLLCFATPPLAGYLGTAIVLTVLLVIAMVARLFPTANILLIMDAPWLEIVRQRSEYLFLDLWSFDDWMRNIRPFLALTLAAIVINEPRIRRLSVAAMLIGLAGLVVALTASLVAPIAVLVQGQAWRWVWVTTLMAVAFLAPTVICAARERGYGPICAIFLLCGWVNSGAGASLTAGALGLWLARKHLPSSSAAVHYWAFIRMRTRQAAESLSGRFKNPNSPVIPTMACLALLAACAILLPIAFEERAKPLATTTDVGFDLWKTIIPPDGNVLIVPSPISAAFAWFVLERPSYLSLDQSSGVVFSRETALEIRRRTEIVQPAWDATWRILSWHMASRRSSRKPEAPSLPLPLTSERLSAMCHDPKLTFVVAKQDVGFSPVKNTHAGVWKEWNLYDCHKVLSTDPAT
jgi:hypothetical protein